MKWARSFGSLEIAIVGMPGHIELAAVDLNGVVLRSVAVKADEIDRAVAGLRECERLLLGAPKQRANDGHHEVLRVSGGKRA